MNLLAAMSDWSVGEWTALIAAIVGGITTVIGSIASAIYGYKVNWKTNEQTKVMQETGVVTKEIKPEALAVATAKAARVRKRKS